MKVDKRLSKEFGTELPPPSYWLRLPSGAQIVEWILAHLVHLSIIPALLATGAVIGRYYPPAVWWFFGVAGASTLCIAAMFVVVLIANTMDHGDDGNYPGS